MAFPHLQGNDSSLSETKGAKPSPTANEYHASFWSAVAPATAFYDGLAYRIV